LRTLAPISISTYNRIEHLRETIKSLKKNDLAKESILYIFLDAPKNGDEEIVQKVRDYVHTIDGFKEVRIIEQKVNDINKNMNDARTIPLEEFGKMIRMEDDNVVSSSFLNYMNDGLDFYENNKKIIAISGFNVPVKYPDNYKYDYYLSTYFNAWGYATWANKGFLDIVNYSDQYNEMMGDKELHKKVKRIHPKLINGLKLIQEGKLNAGDYKMVFHLIKNNLYTIKPIKSFVDNIGHDGSGLHCGVNDRLQNIELNQGRINFTEKINYNKNIDLIYYKYVTKNENLLKRIYNKVFR